MPRSWADVALGAIPYDMSSILAFMAFWGIGTLPRSLQVMDWLSQGICDVLVTIAETPGPTHTLQGRIFSNPNPNPKLQGPT